nr:hypothetical protein [Tanacetum cinerariifolium]
SADCGPEKRDSCGVDSAGAGLADRRASERHAVPAVADYSY